MRMTIVLSHFTMGRPTRMPDTGDISLKIYSFYLVLELCDLSDRLARIHDLILAYYADSCAVIPTIFES